MALTIAEAQNQNLLRRRWWLRGEVVSRIIEADEVAAYAWDFTVPFWAWPFELLHRLAFGKCDMRQVRDGN